ncbi:MAG: phosphoenolpyruvate carboxykinase [Actinomycetota bacterium]|nr:phosphoenolpyruvate carboxykinase [Actinomycetota bacterium]
MQLRSRSVEHRPSREELRRYSEAQPNARISEFGNVNLHTRARARSKGSTLIVSDDPSHHTDPTLDRASYEELAVRQDRYLEDQEVIVLDGFIGDHPDARMPTRLVVERTNANLAAMQQLLYFPPEERFEPELTVIYTPNLPAPGFPDDRLIAVDLEGGVTRVMNSDYFGESKMGGLRMWDATMYRRGGLALHSGLKVIEIDGQRRVGLIVGLSGTGKTTTTFSKQGHSRPVQDDFVALFPGGRVYGTEAGTFAKVYGLTPESEPTIWSGVTSSRTYLENVAQDDHGRLDFFDKHLTENSRAIIDARDLTDFLPPRQVERADFLLLLNRNENIIPSVARLDREQAAAYFMLGETQGTSAGGAAEAGRFLRVPGTNPFFAYRHEWQANRLYELLGTHPLEVYVLNTGRVGGPAGDDRSKKVSPEDSSSIVAAIAAGTIEWSTDRDFGYQVADRVPGVEDDELLQPRRLYERQGRLLEYRQAVEQLSADRRAHLARYPDLLPEIARSIS